MRILTTCLSKCEEVLEQSAEVFAEVKESSLLQEICEVEEGRNKLRGREGGEVEEKEVKRGLVHFLKKSQTSMRDPDVSMWCPYV